MPKAEERTFGLSCFGAKNAKTFTVGLAPGSGVVMLCFGYCAPEKDVVLCCVVKCSVV